MPAPCSTVLLWHWRSGGGLLQNAGAGQEALLLPFQYGCHTRGCAATGQTWTGEIIRGELRRLVIFCNTITAAQPQRHKPGRGWETGQTVQRRRPSKGWEDCTRFGTLRG